MIVRGFFECICGISLLVLGASHSLVLATPLLLVRSPETFIGFSANEVALSCEVLRGIIAPDVFFEATKGLLIKTPVELSNKVFRAVKLLSTAQSLVVAAPLLLVRTPHPFMHRWLEPCLLLCCCPCLSLCLSLPFSASKLSGCRHPGAIISLRHWNWLLGRDRRLRGCDSLSLRGCRGLNGFV